MATLDTTQTPLRLTSQWEKIVGGTGPGDLTVVMARAGVGKTTFLAQIGLDHLLRGHSVLHVTAGQTVEHLQARYDALVDDWADLCGIAHKEELRAELGRRRMITAFSDLGVTLGRIEETADTYRRHLDFAPKAILLDGFDWDATDTIKTAAILGGARSYCKIQGATLWVAAKTHREVTGPHPTEMPEPCGPLSTLIQTGVFLEPHSDGVHMRVLKGAESADDSVLLDSDTMRPIAGDRQPTQGPNKLPTSAFTLLSGGAAGAEAAFGEAAQRMDIKEQNFTFEGRTMVREVSKVVLSDAELAQGAVSEVYLKAKMRRTYPDSPIFRKTLQSIWHQVKTAGEVFVIGVVLEDGTVKGGTGWAAELARHWNKPVVVFDQERRTWLRWVADSGTWEELSEEPRIGTRRFCGTGTRYLSDEGKAAIESLFARSFAR